MAAQRQQAMDNAIAQDIVRLDSDREKVLATANTKAAEAAAEAAKAKDDADTAHSKADQALKDANAILNGLNQKATKTPEEKIALDEQITKATDEVTRLKAVEQAAAADKAAKEAADHAKTEREAHEDFQKKQEEARTRVRER